MKQSIWNKPFIAICLCNFFLFMTINSLITTLPIYVIEVLNQSEKEIGYVLLAFTLGSIFVRVFAGYWVDRFGKKQVLWVSLFFFLVISSAHLVVNHLILLLLIRFIHGFGFGVASTTTMAAAIDLLPEKRRGEGISYFTMSLSISMALAPYIGLTIISTYNFTILFIMCMVYGLLSLFFYKIANVPAVTQENKKPFILNWKHFFEIKAIPIAIVVFVLALAQSTIQTYLPVYASKFGAMNLAGYFMALYAIMVIFSRSFTGKILDRYGANYVIYPSLLLYCLGLIGLSLVNNPFVLIAIGGLTGLGYGTLLPSFMTMATTSTTSDRRGVATSTVYLFFDSGLGLGAVLLGMIAFHTSYSIMYLGCAAIVGVVASLYFLVQLKGRGKSERKVSHSS